MKGSLVQRGRTWYAVIDLPKGPDGRRRQKWHRLAASGKRQAQAELAKLIADLASGRYVEPSKLSLADFLLKWLEVVHSAVSAKTFERYRGIVVGHLIPHLGAYPLARLQPLHIQAYYSRALQGGRLDGRAGGLAPQTVLHHHRVLKEALGQAVRWGLLARNPADAVDPPRVARKEMRTLTPEQIARLLAAAQGSRLYIPILLAVATGMRRGEILALRWEDVDLGAGTVSVRRTLEQVRGRIAFKEPKSARSRRVIPLPAFAVAALRRHKAEQARLRLRLGPAYDDQGLVCTTETGRPLAHNFGRDYLALLERAGVPRVRFHDLRHSHATLLLSQNVHPKVVSERLGHAAVGVTLDIYSHVVPALQQEAADKLEALLGGVAVGGGGFVR
jgi:integrase